MNKKISKKFGVGIGLVMFLLLPLENVCAFQKMCNFSSGGGNIDVSYGLIVLSIVLLIIFYKFIKITKKAFFKYIIAFLTSATFLYLILISALPFWFLGVSYDFKEYVKCKIENGEYVSRKDNSSGCTAKCRLINSDHGKPCKNDNDCEGFCEIENFSEIKKAWDKNFYNLKTEYDAYEPIALDKWIGVTGIEPVGKCNKFKEVLFFSSICINDCTVIRVTDRNITRAVNTHY